MAVFVIFGALIVGISFLSFRLVRRDARGDITGDYIYVQSASIIGAAGMMTSPSNSEAMALLGGMSPFSGGAERPVGKDSDVPF